MDLLDNLRKQNTVKATASATMDNVGFAALDSASTYELSNLRLSVASSVATWAETTEAELDEGESLADRMDGLLVGICDADKDGDLTDEELSVLDTLYTLLADYLTQQGADAQDVDALINDGNEEAAERIQELLVGVLPSGEEAEVDAINQFAFDADSDAAVMDAAYRKRVAVRNGRKIIVRKRISGRVRLSAKQKMAVLKMHRKSHSGMARMKRAKSMRRRASMGL
ncbi:50S ribosomal protein L34 [Hydromonas duriensis]|uniref:EF-hand domain-containing protein n=1 Tax=Hydromonas duriensis TaxID=1527608 RepID=A0A4R6Y270_9BURK|nr:50S ribosomal protein L34 [Hydromonas duriensis]TDR30340.1 hypothetical protein DFR44_1229 [Hydromonas duriensis]